MNEKLQIEQEFANMKHKYINQGKVKSWTNCQDVLQIMVDQYETKKWWWAWEFVGRTNSKGRYLSHRAPARASDLAIHTDLVEDRKIGRFKVYRVKRENREKVLEYLKN